jgi:hypothetical protein
MKLSLSLLGLVAGSFLLTSQFAMADETDPLAQCPPLSAIQNLPLTSTTTVAMLSAK